MFEDLEKILMSIHNKKLREAGITPSPFTDFIAEIAMEHAIKKTMEDLEKSDRQSANKTESDNWTNFQFPLPSENVSVFQKLGKAFANFSPPKELIYGINSPEDKKETEDHRRDILEGAIQCVCSDRESQYGSPERSFEQIATFWSGYLDHEITPHDVGVMMALMKIARIKTGRFKQDSYVDACGYLACAGEIAEKNEE